MQYRFRQLKHSIIVNDEPVFYFKEYKHTVDFIFKNRINALEFRKKYKYYVQLNDQYIHLKKFYNDSFDFGL